MNKIFDKYTNLKISRFRKWQLRHPNKIKQHRTKIYITKWINGKATDILAIWSQRRCVKCQRFLSDRQIKYCTRCKPIEEKKYNPIKRREKYVKTGH